MLTKAHRFHGHGSLNYVYTHGKTLRGQLMSLKYVQNKKRADFRVSVVVSRKVHKSAVVRNRIRRRIYETVRINQTLIPGHFDLVFIVYSDAVATILASELQDLIVGLLKKLSDIPKVDYEHGIVEKKEN